MTEHHACCTKKKLKCQKRVFRSEEVTGFVLSSLPLPIVSHKDGALFKPCIILPTPKQVQIANNPCTTFIEHNNMNNILSMVVSLQT